MRFEREVILGAMVFIGAAILVLGSMWLSENFAGPAGGYRLHVSMESVMGVHRGTELSLRGVQVGKVLNVHLERGRPLVEVGFRDIRSVPRDSRFILRSTGLLGDRVIEVRMGTSSQVFQDGDMVIGESELGIEDLMSDAAKAAGMIQAAVDSIAGPENVRRMSASVSRMDAVTGDLHAIMEKNRNGIDRALQDLAAASSDVGGIISGNRVEIERAIGALDSTSSRLASSAASVDRAAASLVKTVNNLESITGKIDRGEGTLGHFVNDDGLYLRMESTISSADSLLGAVKRDPGRYLNFKFTLF